MATGRIPTPIPLLDQGAAARALPSARYPAPEKSRDDVDGHEGGPTHDPAERTQGSRAHSVTGQFRRTKGGPSIYPAANRRADFLLRIQNKSGSWSVRYMQYREFETKPPVTGSAQIGFAAIALLVPE
jgi:hypothetical protein